MPEREKKEIKGTRTVSPQEAITTHIAQQNMRIAVLEAIVKSQEKVVRNIHEDATPIEVLTEVTNELTAKGDPKPSARIRITRKLTNSADVKEIVINDLKLGEEETAAAIQKAVEPEVEKEE